MSINNEGRFTRFNFYNIDAKIIFVKLTFYNNNGCVIVLFDYAYYE